MDKTALKTATLGETGLEITRVGFGAWAIGGGGYDWGWGSQDDEDSIAAIHRALGLGVIGLGMAGAVMVRAAARHPGTVLTAAADPQPASGRGVDPGGDRRARLAGARTLVHAARPLGRCFLLGPALKPQAPAPAPVHRRLIGSIADADKAHRTSPGQGGVAIGPTGWLPASLRTWAA